MPTDANVYQEAADKLPMTPPPNALEDVMRELKTIETVRNYVETKALANNPTYGSSYRTYRSNK
ncbi:hypothetical protein ACFFUP_07000 [Vibrio ostreicida]|uniref:Uncharacterized protein n=1 Tax=Vibrio ostreicida TaxID=526588 RepID=A0ABT8BT62_9VIBR|nr:hypothetical protein [Vibrio ostreicida]MDN3609280.1 hypothetical protein [Vibrio ostreicida]NPD08171.1 hypothetical protein [Vibrio ostreicida]